MSDDSIVWIAIGEGAFPQLLRDGLASQISNEIICGADTPEGRSIAVIVADARNAACVDRAWEQPAACIQTIVMRQPGDPGVRADFVLNHDCDTEELVAACSAALAERSRQLDFREDVGRRKSAIGTIMAGTFMIRRLDEARNLATMLSLASEHPDLTAMGLQELLVNAIEHGNLEISGDEKQALILEGRWQEEVDRRLADPHYAGRVVVVTFNRRRESVSVCIADEGRGFDYHAMAESDADASTYHGRGILIAREVSFSDVRYQGRGNSVTATWT